MKPLFQTLVAVVLLTGAARADGHLTPWSRVADDATYPDTPAVNAGTTFVEDAEISTGDVVYRGTRTVYVQTEVPPTLADLESNGLQPRSGGGAR